MKLPIALFVLLPLVLFSCKNVESNHTKMEALPEDQLFSLGLPQPAEGVEAKPDEVMRKWFFEVQETLFFVAFTGNCNCYGFILEKH